MKQSDVADRVRSKINRLASVDLCAQEHDPYGYRRTYQGLKRLFENYLDLECEEDILAGACAVYGWMPTILKRIGDCAPFCAFAKQLRGLNLSGAVSLLGGLKYAEREILLTVLNNSVVGTSKFLHFATNGELPIWDSVVARNLGFRAGHTKPDRYVVYAQAIDEVLSGNAFAILPNLTTFVESYGAVSRTRAVEFGLYISRGAA